MKNIIKAKLFGCTDSRFNFYICLKNTPDKLSVLSKSKKIFAIILFLLLQFNFCRANSVEYSTKWTINQTPEQLIQRYIDLGDTTYLMSTLKYANQNFHLYKSLSFYELVDKATAHAQIYNPELLAEFYRLTRKYYIESGNKVKSMEYALKVYNILSKSGNTDDMLWTLVEIGNIFFSEKDYNQAANLYQKAREVGERTDDYFGLSVVFLNFGMVEDRKGNYENALKEYNISAEYRGLAGNEKFLANTYIKIAETLLHQKNFKEAMKNIHLAELFYNEKGKPNILLASTPFEISMTYSRYYFAQGDYKKTQNYLYAARDFAQKNQFTTYYFETYFTEVEQLISQEKYSEVIPILKSIIPELEKKSLRDDLRNAYRILTTCYFETQQLQKAKISYNRFLLWNDTLNQAAMVSQLNTMRTLTAVYESDYKMQNFKQNLEIASVNNRMESRQKNIFYSIFGIGSVTILVLLILFLNLRKNKLKLQELHFQSLIQNNEIKIKSIELQRSDQIKDKLFSIIAHDLRNPLNRLLVETAIVKKSIANSEVLEPMENTLKETIGLFERLLQWSKMDNKQNIYSPVKINLNENINKVITFYLPEMKLREITITNNSITHLVFADPNILQTLLRNFLSNSISILGKGGKVDIEINQIADEVVEMQISDSGPGFPEELINNFHFEKNEINAADNGLGLTLCKVLAKMSGWPLKIDNESKLGGARITIVLPTFKGKKRSSELNVITRAFEPTPEWKEKLLPIQEFKFYQTSQIRLFLKSLGKIDDPQVRLWVNQIERAVHQGDKQTFSSLIELISN